MPLRLADPLKRSPCGMRELTVKHNIVAVLPWERAVGYQAA